MHVVGILVSQRISKIIFEVIPISDRIVTKNH